MTFDPMSVEVTCVTLPKDHFVQVPQKYIEVCGYTDPIFQKLEKGHWPIDDLWPHVCWGHMSDSTQGSMCPSPLGIHQCIWIQRSILQNYHILHTYILHNTYRMSDHIVSHWTQFRWDNDWFTLLISLHLSIYLCAAITWCSYVCLNWAYCTLHLVCRMCKLHSMTNATQWSWLTGLKYLFTRSIDANKM